LKYTPSHLYSMTRFLFSALVLVSFLFGSCGKDEPENTVGNMVGNWQIKTVKCDDCKTVTATANGKLTNLVYKMTGKDVTIKVNFNADLTSQSVGSYTAVLNGKLDDQPYTNEIPLSTFNYSGTYLRTGDKLDVARELVNELDISNGKYLISDETANTMTLTTQVEQSISPQPDVQVRHTGTYVLTFERQ
jgi:hypothetical protein